MSEIISSERHVVVNDIDGEAVNTVFDDSMSAVMAEADDRLKRQILAAVDNGGTAIETFRQDGEEYTVRVVVR
jgi:hypothetical protein